jgi:hypothetical protein
MLVTTLLIFLVAFAAAMFLSWDPRLGSLRDTAANPMLLLAAYIFLVGGDYLSMVIMHGGQLAQRDVIAANSTLTWLAFQHALTFCTLCGGIFTGLAGAELREGPTMRPLQQRPPRTSRRRDRAAIWAFLILLFIWAVLLRQSGSEDSSFTESIATNNNLIGNATLFTTSLLLLPAFTYALTNATWRTALILTGVAAAVVFLSGSRTRLLYVAIPLLLAMVKLYRIRLPRYFFLAGLVVAGVLSVLVLNLRLASAFGDDADFTSVSGANIFDLNDISFAETSVALNNISASRIEGYVGEDLVGALLAGVPRSVAPIKPLSGSNQFTSVYDPIGWKAYGRGLTIGGINELDFDYGYPAALIVVSLMGVLLGYLLGRVAKATTVHGFAGLVAIYAMLYQFLKADMQSAGQVAFSFLVYYLAILIARSIDRVISPKKAGRARLRPARQSAAYGDLKPSRPRITR